MKQPPLTGPFILSIETATAIGSVAVFSGEMLLGSMEIRKGKSHARLITPMVKMLLESLEIDSKDIAAVGVAKGPGSYTGLRVGVSTAKGLCLAWEKPLLSMGSLEALAWQVQELAQELNAWICPMIDARRMEVYCAFYDAEMNEQIATDSAIIEEGAFAEILKERKVIFLGDGAKKCKEIFSSSPNAIVISESLSSASSMGKGLFHKYENQSFEDLVTFEPYYLKDFVATKSKKNPFLRK